MMITLAGEYDLARCSELDSALEPAANVPHVIIDLSGVTYVDSTCLTRLVKLRNRREAQGLPLEMLVIAEPAVLKLFNITGLDMVWPIAGTLDAALALAEPARTAGGS